MRRQVVQPGNDMQRTLRNYIDRLDENGELLEYKKKVNWKYDIGRITRELFLKEKFPKTLLFTNVSGYPGFRVLTNGLAGTSKLSLVLEEDPDSSLEALVSTFKKRFSAGYDPQTIPQTSVNQITLKGAEANMEKLPVPWWSPLDAGRYVGTWHLNITKDPETGMRNIGIYRMQMIDGKKAFVSFSPRSDFAKHLEKAEQTDQPLEMAVAIGVNDCFIMAGASSINSGKDEYWHAGGLLGGPAKLRRCSSVDLEVPLESEIVLEGHILPHERGVEGPFLDYAGVPKGNPAAAIFELQSITMKQDPIFRGAAVGVKGGEDHLLYSLLAKTGVLDFHGSRIRHHFQCALLTQNLFGLFQLSGRIGRLFNKVQAAR